VQRSVFNVRNAVVGLGGALALRHFAQDIDNLAKLSARLDVPIQSLQELRFAAAQTGTEAKQSLQELRVARGADRHRGNAPDDRLSALY
jgi:hypothetical protein